MSQATDSPEILQCGHCGNIAPMRVVAQYSQMETYYQNGPGSYSWDEGNVYELLLCPACSSVTLRCYFWRDNHMESFDETVINYLYPDSSKKPSGLPPKIQKAYDAAIKVKHVNAYAVLVGRVLDMIYEDRSASGKNLYEKLDDLSRKGEIPEKLVKVADNLRHLRNVGAHADLGELTQSDEPMLSSSFNAILEYVYSAPYLVQKAEDQLKKLKESKK